MQELVQIELVASLFKVLGFAFAIWGLVYMIKRAISEWKNSPKDAIDEIICIMLIIAVTGYVIFTKEGLTTFALLLDTLMSLVFTILFAVLELLSGAF